MKRPLIVGLLLSVACANPGPPSPDQLFVDVDRPAVVPAHADRARVVRVGAHPVLDPNGPSAQSSARSTIVLPLFDDTVVRAIHDNVVVHGPHAYTWVGHVEGEPDSEVLLSYRGAQLHGVVRRASSSFVIQPIGDGEQLIMQVAADTLVEADQPEQPVLDLWDTSWTAADADGEDPVIDVLVVYSDPVKKALGSAEAVQALAELSITQANKGLADSRVSTSFRLVAVEATGWDEKSFTFNAALTGVATKGDGLLDTVPGLRDKHGADVVTMLVVGDLKACGLGYLMTSARPAFAPAAYTVVDYTCAATNYSLAHEIGHNMGSHHDRDNAVGSPSYPFSYGYQVPSEGYRSIMAYSCKSESCGRVNRWSNPDVKHLGVASGVAKSSEASAHNASSLSLTAPVVADFRDAIPEAAPVEAAEVLLPADGSTLSSASLALVWDDVGADEYLVTVGSASGKDDLHHKSAGTSTTWTVTGLPVDGSKLHVKVWTRFAEDWYTDAVTYTAYKDAADVASIVSPPAESTLKGAAVTFTWEDAGADGYMLRLGSSRWTADLGAFSTKSTSASVTGLPTDGRTIWATLYSEDGGRWYSETVTYSAKAPASGPPEPARLISPDDDAVLSGSTLGFEWTRPTGATGYALTLIGEDGTTLYNETMAGTAARVVLEDAPTGVLSIELGTRLDEHWFIREYTFETD